MRTIFQGLGGRFTRLFAARKSTPDRSRLFGMYLSEANGRDAHASEFQQKRDRGDAKFSQNRERS
jgi:hypothetical protein